MEFNDLFREQRLTNGETLLHSFVRRGLNEEVRFLLAVLDRENLALTDNFGHTPLHYAAKLDKEAFSTFLKMQPETLPRRTRVSMAETGR